MHQRLFLRNIDADEFFVDFLVCAVVAILGVRTVLHLTGYPSIGGDKLHIAHMLPGGLLMLVAILLLFGYLGSGVIRLAAIVGGAGFGIFIDELGKFVTRNNDYFFQPTAALIYVIFMVTYLAFQATRKSPLTRQESVANALKMLLEAIRHDLDPEEKARALELLERGGDDRRDPVVEALEEAFRRIDAVAVQRPSRFTRLKSRLRNLYLRLATRRWFAKGVAGFFVVYALVAIATTAVFTRELAASAAVLAAALLTAVAAVQLHGAGKRNQAIALYGATLLITATAIGIAVDWGALPRYSFFEWGELVASVTPAVFLLAGIFQLTRSRLMAYRWFERAVLFQIFVTQFFAFYHAQFVAAAVLFLNLLLFAALRYAIHREEWRHGGQDVAEAVPA